MALQVVDSWTPVDEQVLEVAATDIEALTIPPGQVNGALIQVHEVGGATADPCISWSVIGNGGNDKNLSSHLQFIILTNKSQVQNFRAYGRAASVLYITYYKGT